MNDFSLPRSSTPTTMMLLKGKFSSVSHSLTPTRYYASSARFYSVIANDRRGSMLFMNPFDVYVYDTDHASCLKSHQPVSFRGLLSLVIFTGGLVWLFSASSFSVFPTGPSPSWLERTGARDAIRNRPSSSASQAVVSSKPATAAKRKGPKIAKVSMLYGAPNGYYERAIESHERHAKLHGYPVHVLHHDISQGYWNKPTYILSLIVQELSKAPEERAEWLMLVFTTHPSIHLPSKDFKLRA